jgi:LysR family transcriptional regulator, nitrogen assimilation regulatory protein
MNVATVKLFLEVAEAGSLSKVAARRQTVQSHVSRQITDFEQQCGGRLFRRTGRGVELTEHGARAASRLRAWLQATEQLEQELRSESGQLMGEVRLGIIPSAAHPLVTHLFSRLQTEHPGIRLNVAEAQGAELDAMLDSGAVDLAVLFRYSKPAGSDERLLGVAQTFLVAAPGDEITRAPTVGFARLKGLRLVLPRRPSHWRNALDDTARGLGFRLEAVAEADSLTVQRELVARTPGLYSVLGPYSIAGDLKAGRVQASRLVRPELCRHVTLSFPRQGKFSPACRVVASTLERLVESWGHKLTEP